MEIWKPVPDFEGCYEVSSEGRVRSLDKLIVLNNGGEYIKYGRILKQASDKYGYRTVILRDSGRSKMYKVHRLVALTFIENPDGFPQINHRDENKANNKVDNLEWCTLEYNCKYGTRLERLSKSRMGIGKGIKLSEETRRKMSIAHSKPSGRIVSESTRKKISDSLKGYNARRRNGIQEQRDSTPYR